MENIIEEELGTIAEQSYSQDELLSNLSNDLPRLIKKLAPMASRSQRYQIESEMQEWIESERGERRSPARQPVRRPSQPQEDDTGGIRVFDEGGGGGGMQW